MFGHSKKKNALCDVCNVVSIIIAVVAALATLAALTGVYKAHVLSTGLVFGTTSGSMALIALAINLFLVKKAMANCMCQLPSKK